MNRTIGSFSGRGSPKRDPGSPRISHPGSGRASRGVAEAPSVSRLGKERGEYVVQHEHEPLNELG